MEIKSEISATVALQESEEQQQQEQGDHPEPPLLEVWVSNGSSLLC
jgi:hypothetical protein